MTHSNLSSFKLGEPVQSSLTTAVPSVDANPLVDGLELATELLDSITTEGSDIITTG